MNISIIQQTTLLSCHQNVRPYVLVTYQPVYAVGLKAGGRCNVWGYPHTLKIELRTDEQRDKQIFSAVHICNKGKKCGDVASVIPLYLINQIKHRITLLLHQEEYKGRSKICLAAVVQVLIVSMY